VITAREARAGPDTGSTPVHTTESHRRRVVVHDALEDEAIRRAHDGTMKPVFHGGKKVGEVREYSDKLLIFLLKGCKPEKYAVRRKFKHSGAVDHPGFREPAEDLKRMLQDLMDEDEDDAAA